MCDNNDFCRICLENEDLVSIFPERSGIVSIKTIFSATGIQIKETDRLPSALCPACMQAIENAHELRKKAEKSDVLLKQVYDPGNNVQMTSQDEIETDEENEEDPPEMAGKKYDYKCDSVETSAAAQDQKVDLTRMKVSDPVVWNANEIFPTATSSVAASSVSEIKPPAKTNADKYPTFICEICGKEIKRKAHYDDHINTHTDLRPFHCKLCPLRFNYKANLIRHMLVHSGEKPYKCDLCPNSYRANHNLKLHKLEKHGNKEDWKYQCQLCSRAFVYKNLLSTHMKKQHSEGSFAKKSQQTRSFNNDEYDDSM